MSRSFATKANRATVINRYDTIEKGSSIINTGVLFRVFDRQVAAIGVHLIYIRLEPML